MNVYKLQDIAGDVQQDSKNGKMLDELLWEKEYYDAYRTCHPYTKCFSHKPKDSNYPRRLDYAIVSKEINKNIIECDYIHEVNNYYDRNLGFTDHSAVVLEIQLKNDDALMGC